MSIESEIAWLDRREGGGSLGRRYLEDRSWSWWVDHHREQHVGDQREAHGCSSVPARRSWARTGVLRGLAARELARDIECGRINGSVRRLVAGEMREAWLSSVTQSGTRRMARLRARLTPMLDRMPDLAERFRRYEWRVSGWGL